MKIRLDREDTEEPSGSMKKATTWGDLYIYNDETAEWEYFCCTLEDKVREEPGIPVSRWKIAKETAIGSGVLEMRLESSNRFGPNTPTIMRVPGFDYIRMHGGKDVDSSEGCPILGDAQDRLNGFISGGKIHGVVDKLKARMLEAQSRGDRIWIQIRNGKGWYEQHGLPYPAEV